MSKVLYFLKILNLHKLKDTLNIKRQDWSHLSRGEQQRLAVIRVLLLDTKPEILLMDEPTASIDPDNAKIVDALIKYHSPKSMILFIEHVTGRKRTKSKITISGKEKETAEIVLDEKKADEERQFQIFLRTYKKDYSPLEIEHLNFK